MTLFDLKPFTIVGTVSQTETLKRALVDSSFLAAADLVELRLDETMDLDEAYELCTQIRQQKPILLTIRTQHEGGTWTISEEDRYQLFLRFAPVVDCYDIELKSGLFATKKRSDFPKDKVIISSYHDYVATPDREEIEAFIRSGQDWQVDVVKLALTAEKEEDVVILEEILADSSAELCLIAMSAIGARSRKEFPAKGSLLTYGYLDESVAPGQFSAVELAEYLKA